MSVTVASCPSRIFRKPYSTSPYVSCLPCSWPLRLSPSNRKGWSRCGRHSTDRHPTSGPVGQPRRPGCTSSATVAQSGPRRKGGFFGPVGPFRSGHSLVLTPATRQRLSLEFLATLQDAFPPAEVYIVRRDVAKPFVVSVAWEEARDDVRRVAKPYELPSLDLWSLEFLLAR